MTKHMKDFEGNTYKNIADTSFGIINIAILKRYLHRQFVGFEVCLRKEIDRDHYATYCIIPCDSIVEADVVYRKINEMIIDMALPASKYIVHGNRKSCRKIATYGACDVYKAIINGEPVYEVYMGNHIIQQFSLPLDAFRYAYTKGNMEQKIIDKVSEAMKKMVLNNWKKEEK